MVMGDRGNGEVLSSQRVKGIGGLSIHFKDGCSRIHRLYQEGAAKIRMPQVRKDPLEAILINTAGGLTGGDSLNWTVEVGEGASSIVTTQACERIYRSSGGEARIVTKLKAAKGTHLAWLPQETILFNRSVLSRDMEVEMDEDAHVLIAETTVFGRKAMGETVNEARFSDRWRISCGGRLVHAQALRLGPDMASQLQAAPVANGAFAVATVLLVSQMAERHLDAVRAIIGLQGGASVWQLGGVTKLVVRLFAEDSYTLRKRLVPLLALLNGQAELPKVWSI